MNKKLADLLQKAVQGKQEKKTGEWKTVNQWAAEWKVCRAYAGMCIKRFVESGVFEMKRFYVQGVINSNIPHYREVKK